MMLRRVGRNVADIAQMTAFYQTILGCEPLGPVADDPWLANHLMVARAASQRLKLGAQQLELTQCFPPGAPYPEHAKADDLRFQHIAVVTTDISAAFARAIRAGAAMISIAGPQQLPAAAGGVIAWKFRDPDGHPLEFLQFPLGSPWQGTGLILGYDHSAISVADAGRSIAFYGELGFTPRQRQINHGPAQARLDGLVDPVVEVVSLTQSNAPPHVELLAYRTEIAGDVSAAAAGDIAADRLVFQGAVEDDGLRRDPDGHISLLDSRP